MNEPKVVETTYVQAFGKSSMWVPANSTPAELKRWKKINDTQFVPMPKSEKEEPSRWRAFDRERRRSIDELCGDADPRFRPAAGLERSLREYNPPWWPVDRPLVPLLNAVWAHGAQTGGCCAGHSDGSAPIFGIFGRTGHVLRMVARLRSVLSLYRLDLSCRPTSTACSATLYWGYQRRQYSKSDLAALDAMALRAAARLGHGPSDRIPADLAMNHRFLRRTIAALRPTGRPRPERVELCEHMPGLGAKHERWSVHLELARLWHADVSAPTLEALRRALKAWERKPHSSETGPRDSVGERRQVRTK